MKILVADDSLFMQKMMVQMLNNLGYNADVASNGQEVLASLQKNWYDIIFMDVQMPVMDGLEASSKIASSPRPTIVAVTADGDQKQVMKCLEAGMNDYLCKPVTPDALQKVMEKWKP